MEALCGPKRWRVLVGMGVAAGVLTAAGGGQRPGPDEVRVSAHAYDLGPAEPAVASPWVSVEVVVRDRQGRPVGGLDQDQFRLYDNGQMQPLAQFSVLNRAPEVNPRASAAAAAVPAAAARARYLGLYFDDVNTPGGDLMRAREAALRFTGEMLGAHDWVAVYTASGVQGLDFTRDRAALQRAIAALSPHPRAASGGQGCLRLSPYQAFQIAVRHDPAAVAAAQANLAVCEPQGRSVFPPEAGDTGMPPVSSALNQPPLIREAAEAMWRQTRIASQVTLDSLAGAVADVGQQPGARVLLLASGGFLGGTLEPQQEAVIRQALRLRVTISALVAGGLTGGQPAPLDQALEQGVVPQDMYTFSRSGGMPEQMEREAALAHLALSTGGLLFHNNNDLGLGFERLGLAPAVAYELRFLPAGREQDGRFHTLNVEVRPDDHYTIQARRGYYASPPDTAAAHLDQAIAAALRSGAAQSGLKVQARIEGLTMHFHVDLGSVPFVTQDGRRRDRLVFTVALFDAQGRFLLGKQGEMDLNLRDETWQRLAASGLNGTLTLTTVPEAAQVRCVVVEANTGKLYAASRP